MLSLKSQISVLDNFVIREESISPVLALMNKDSVEQQIISDASIKDVSLNSACVISLDNQSSLETDF